MSESRYEYLGQRRHQALVGRSSRSAWEMSVTHRQMILQLLPGDPQAGRRGTLCVLGAGQCHDLNLEALLARFHELHLVDVDGHSLEAGTDAQKQFSSARIRRHGGLDITGVRDLLEQHRQAADPELLEQVAARHAPPELGLEQFDVVLSADVLPEILGHAVACLGNDNHPGRAELVTQLAQQHLETLLELTTPGGQAILVTGLATSESVPELTRAPEKLSEMLRLADSRGAVRPGVHPAALDQRLKTDSALVARLQRYDVSPLWIRQLPEETVLYVAYRLVRRDGDDE